MKSYHLTSPRLNRILIFLMSFGVFCTTTSFTFTSQPLDADHPDTWTRLASNDQVEINYRYMTCDLPSEGMNNEYMFLQIINKVNNELTVEWDAEYIYNNTCIGCEPNNIENHISLVLQPGETMEGNCTTFRNQALAILSKMLHIDTSTELTEYNVNSLSTTLNVN